MAKLSDTATIILAAAAQHQDRRALPIPKGLRAPAVVVRKTLAALVKGGLLEEVRAASGDEIWRETDDGRVSLAINSAGFAAVGIEHEATASAARAGKRDKRPVRAKTAGQARTSAKKAGRPAKGAKNAKHSRTVDSDGKRLSKQDALLGLLRSARGATISEMQKATGWAPHSIRGWMSGTAKKRLGLAIASEKDGGAERRYFVLVLRSR